MQTINCQYVRGACIGHACYYCGLWIMDAVNDQVERWIGCADGTAAESALHKTCAVEFPAFSDAMAALA